MCAGEVSASSCNSVSSCERNMQNGHVEAPIVKPLSQGTPSSEPTRSVHVTEPHDTLSSSADSSVSSCKVAPDDTFECDCFRKASHEIRELQIVDSDLVPYFQYLEEKKIPPNERQAKKLILECEKMEIIDGVLHHEDTADPSRWCIVVPQQFPLTQRGNKYVVVFMDYFTKWVEAYAVPDQQAQTVARLLVENIVCRHGVPQELLSDRGSNFLSDLMLEVCSLLGIKKLNTSSYHPQTDGLVEKFVR